jgi:hypothetical protein
LALQAGDFEKQIHIFFKINNLVTASLIKVLLLQYPNFAKSDTWLRASPTHACKHPFPLNLATG